MKYLHMITWILILVGGINWGLVGLGMWFGGGNWNVVNLIFGSWPVIEGLIYVLVGLSAVYELAVHRANCKACTMRASAPMASSA